jgi:hypothetical protein
VSIDRPALLGVLRAMPLQPGRWVVAGSAPLLMAGLIDWIEDVDVVADATAWTQAVDLCGRSPRVGLFGDHMLDLDVAGVGVEVFDGWLGIDAAQMIAEADDVDGIRLSPLVRVLDSKHRLKRPRDLAHIDILEAHLFDGSTAERR